MCAVAPHLQEEPPASYGRGYEEAPFRELRLCSGRFQTATVRERADIAPSRLPYRRGSKEYAKLRPTPA